MGHYVNFGTHHLNVCDPNLRHWLLHDIMGIAQDRAIINTNQTLRRQSFYNKKKRMVVMLKLLVLWYMIHD
ncbi:unnamed protein product [Linum tenue]|uniref:Uncharacterized protein n=1 Tax=Linum tenue TaxID=586396 RepID=A0AAV0RWV6_9ROSI|nr:unnamed protein product [Linum tenue]